jgi:hypothetical protein
MQNKAHLIQAFDQAREKMRAVLPGIDIHMEIYPNWTIREIRLYDSMIQGEIKR